VATRHDLDNLRTVMSGEIAASELRLRTEMAGLEVRLLTAFGEFRDQFHAEQRATNRQIVLALVVVLVSVVLSARGLR
jgi:hypothetical protein